MPEFVLNRTFVLDAPGHKIRFEKGAPTYVPPELVKDAIGIGAEPLDMDKDDAFEEEKGPPAPLTAEEKEVLFFAAFEQLIARNERDDFGGDGKPAVDALKKIVGFGFTKKDRDAAYQKFREMKEAEKD